MLPRRSSKNRPPAAATTSGGAEPSTTHQKPVVFLHVMKCGGTSVRFALAMGAAGRLVGPEIFELDGGVANAVVGGTNAENWAFRDALLAYVLQTMRPSIVLGHFRYRDRFRDLLDSAHFVTVLRDPVDRIVSLYKYRRYKEGVDLPVAVGFAEFIATNRWAKEGHKYVDTFCGNDDHDPRSDEAVVAAVANLRRLAAVGFIDRLDEFSSRVTTCLGKPVTIPMFNQSPAPEAGDEIDAATLQHVRAVCEPDIRVYEQARAALT
jgi:hypothetical protein